MCPHRYLHYLDVLPDCGRRWWAKVKTPMRGYCPRPWDLGEISSEDLRSYVPPSRGLFENTALSCEIGLYTARLSGVELCPVCICCSFVGCLWMWSNQLSSTSSDHSFATPQSRGRIHYRRSSSSGSLHPHESRCADGHIQIADLGSTTS